MDDLSTTKFKFLAITHALFAVSLRSSLLHLTTEFLWEVLHSHPLSQCQVKGGEFQYEPTVYLFAIQQIGKVILILF